jgi:hypothetical protein
MSLFKIDAEKHRHLADEFRKNPVGIHSPALQKILNVFRGSAMAGKYVLICVKPHQEWRLAQLGQERGDPLILKDQSFHSIEEAEWEIFKIRWQHYTGESLQ